MVSKRRLSGEGSVTKRKDGRWMARFYITLPNGERKRQHIVLKDKNEVLRRMNEEMTQADRGMAVVHDRRTVAEWIEYWLDEIDVDKVKDSTHDMHRRQLERWVISEIDNITLTNLKPDHIRIMIKNWNAKGAGTRGQQIARNTMSACLQDAMKLEYVHRNVVRLVDLPRHETKPHNIWSANEMKTFLDSVTNHKYYGVFLLLCQYGLRRGEAFGLRWKDIDFDKNCIYIRQAVYLVGNELKIGSLKTKASIRDLPMTERIKAELLREYERRGHPQGDELLYLSSVGNPIDGRSFLKTFQLASHQAGLPLITLHEIRHSVATALKDSGVSAKEAQSILGHESITTTLQIYTHTSEEQKSGAISSLADRIFGVTPATQN